MTLTDLQTAIEGLNPYQIDQVAAQVTKYMKLNDELKQTRPDACPICSKADGQLIKKGFQAGKQRYQCKDCGSKFTYDTKQLTAHSHQPVDSWITMIEDTLSIASLDKTAEKISVSTVAESTDVLRRSLTALREHITYASSQSTGLLAI